MKKKHITEIVCAIIGALALIFSAIIGNNEKTDNLQENTSGIVNEVSGDDVNIINGNNNSITSNINNYYDGSRINLEEKSEQELLKMAETAYLAENYDCAFDIYNHKSLNENSTALINRGYIYAKGLSYLGVDYKKANECYNKVKSIEAYRNLLALYLRCGDKEYSENLLDYLLYEVNDYITWDYISYCLYDDNWETYAKNSGITKETFSLEISKLFEFEATGEILKGLVPKKESSNTKWIYKGIDFEHGEEINHPYVIYEKYERLFLKEIDKIEKICFVNT